MEKTEKILMQIGNRNPFKVPENYFIDFQRNMQRSIAAFPQPKTVIYKMRIWLSAAAAAAILLVAGGISYNYYQNNRIAENQAMYDNYVLSQIDDSNLVEYYLTAENE